MSLDEYKKTVRESTFIATERRMKKHILPTFGKMRLRAFNSQDRAKIC